MPTGTMITDLRKQLTNKDTTASADPGYGEVLDFHTTDKVEVLAQAREIDYQGRWFALLRFDGNLWVTEGTFGSCAVCDAILHALEDGDTYPVAERSLSAGNTHGPFSTLDEADTWFKGEHEEEWRWKNLSHLWTEMLDEVTA